MSIDRNNYEEFFLLYIDDELKIADRLAVEDFVRRNPDLEEELNLMKRSVVNPDKSIIFPDKELLRQPETAEDSIHIGNYLEYFVLYTDNELSLQEKARVERFVYDHPKFREEFELIQQTRLTADTSVVFPDKESLYRHEHESRPVLFTFWRIAAAAVLILIAGLLWLNIEKPFKPSGVLVKKENKKSEPGSDLNRTEANEKKTDVARKNPGDQFVPENNIAELGEGSRGTSQPVLSAKPGKEKTKALDKILRSNETRKIVATNTKDDDPSTSEIGNVIKQQNVDGVSPGKIDASLADGRKTIIDEAITDGFPTDHDSKGAVFASTENSETVILSNIPVNKKNSLRGFFRKASRFIDKSTALRTGQKSGILIGNVEIAIQ